MSGESVLPGEYRAELKRVLESEAFRHSDHLRRLLEYLGEKSLSGAGGLKEYTIGVEAFHKPEDYNPQHDPTIRVLASKLRHKLDEYYGKEGAGSSIRIEIPRGHYELKFHTIPPVGNGLAPGIPDTEARKWRWISLVLGASTLLSAFLAFHWRAGSSLPGPPESKRGGRWTPELELIWQPFIEGEHPVIIVLGTPLFTKVSRSFFRNPRLNEWAEARESDQIKLLQKDLQSDYAVPAFPYTGVGEATGAFLLSKLLLPRKPDILIRRSNDLGWDDLGDSDVVFLGPPKFNPLLKDILTEEGFFIERGAIRNLKPRGGEPDAYRSKWTQDQMHLIEDYALIFRFPGPHDHGDMMMLGSASTEGSWAAVEYVSQPNLAKDLVNRVKLPDGQLPKCFQVVIRVEFKQQVPLKMTYVTHRIIAHPWKPAR